MMVAALMIISAATWFGTTDRPDGVIRGVVTNGSEHDIPLAGVEVVLRVGIDGKFASVESAVTRADGSFEFKDLPAGTGHIYLPGANWQDVHFPGPRIVLTEERPEATAALSVYDAVTKPSPLVIERMESQIRVRRGVLEVTETLRIRNPTLRCYVGAPRHAGGGPVTLQLRIPPDFKRITFEREGFGRRFAVINDQLVTGIPWPPGQRELRYTYVLATEQKHRTWSRPLDLPCRELVVRVETDTPESVSSNLRGKRSVDSTTVEFAVRGALPESFNVEVTLGRLPVSAAT